MSVGKHQVGDRVHYTFKVFHKNLFGTVIQTLDSGYNSIFERFSYRVKFDTFQGSSLEGMWIEESHLDPETAIEALAFCMESE